MKSRKLLAWVAGMLLLIAGGVDCTPARSVAETFAARADTAADVRYAFNGTASSHIYNVTLTSGSKHAAAATTSRPAPIPSSIRTIPTPSATASSSQRLDVNALLVDLVAQLHEYRALVKELNQTLEALQERSRRQEIDAQRNMSALRDELRQTVDAARNVTSNLVRQVSVQQLFVEERIRSDGHSGIKRVRGSQDGTKAYYQNKITSGAAALSSHDHSNHDNIPGLGEFVAVMNGVEFRTRHNDYKLVMPSSNSAGYHATQPIPFPQVPPQVTAKSGVSEQIVEMREWFKAWRDQNYTVRDYRQYFKPVMCYLEGAWTQSATKIDEPFASDRHAIDAQSWHELTDKIEFTSYTGRKSINENYAFLPTKIVDIVNGTPVYAQWNYRILCHPLSFDLPLKALEPVDELGVRLRFNLRYDQLASSKLARFRMGPDTNWDRKNREYTYSSLTERIMKEIPGMDNYGANITDDVLYNIAMTPGTSGQPLNAAYYHRWSSLQRQDAMGLSLTRAGFSDENLFVALTNQPKVVAKRVADCYNATACKTFSQRVTYALPLEMIYLTPLHSWNPYKLCVNPAAVVNRGGRDGSVTKPYNGTSPNSYFYTTPVEFFSGGEINANPADTTGGAVSVLDSDGIARRVVASGVRIFFPNIPGVGILRQRYSVFPIHEDGSYAFTEIEALKDAIMDQSTYRQLYRQQASITGGGGAASAAGPAGLTGLTLVTSVAPRPRPHDHSIDLTPTERDFLLRGGTVEKVSSIAEGHNHVIVIGWTSGNATSSASFTMLSCNGAPACGDGHNAVYVNSN